MYMYIIYNIISPPINKNPPIRNPPLGEDFIVTINLDGGTISPLIKYPPWRQILLLSI